jgi:SAM-dependent methyltransferase
MAAREATLFYAACMVMSRKRVAIERCRELLRRPASDTMIPDVTANRDRGDGRTANKSPPLARRESGIGQHPQAGLVTDYGRDWAREYEYHGVIMLSLVRHATIKAQFKLRGPWITRFHIAGNTYGGSFDTTEDTRLARFAEQFSSAEMVLELGSLEGGHTFLLARLPSVERVLAIEGRQYNIDKAKFVQQLLGVENVEFLTANLESLDLSVLGTFDVVYCCGLLYHLPEPWKLVEQVRKVSPNLFLSTHYAPEEKATSTAHGLKGLRHKEFGLRDPLSGLSADSFWPTLDSLREMLRQCQFHSIEILDIDPHHKDGPGVLIAARAG